MHKVQEQGALLSGKARKVEEITAFLWDMKSSFHLTALPLRKKRTLCLPTHALTMHYVTSVYYYNLRLFFFSQDGITRC